MYAQAKVSSAYGKYSKVPNMSRITGAEAAQKLLLANGLGSVRVEISRGLLSDHYDPGKKVLRLSPQVYHGASVAAVGIVAHEVGHALQDATGYAMMKFRTALVPAATLGSQLGYAAVIFGALLAWMGSSFGITVIWTGVFLFSLVVLFSLVTLPVEYNASYRAREMLQGIGLVSRDEYYGASAVLSAAALTYVAAPLQVVAQLFYFIMIALGGRRQ
ncbi:MAG: zinc metallopeptidase [Dehalococcoidia bacterium]|nr:zinc metallopeptidase [Dehalococcoidia bacterium]